MRLFSFKASMHPFFLTASGIETGVWGAKERLVGRSVLLGPWIVVSYS